MSIEELIKFTLDMKKKFNNNIFNIINEYDINIRYVYIEDISNIFACNLKMYDIYFIFLNSRLINESNKQFILAHEIAHILLHDTNCRMFNSACISSDKYEVQANIFATIFLEYIYRDCDNYDYLQKIINYVHANYKLCDFSYCD